ncbi:putative leucine rich repeat protein [Coleophoma cylindrospora]|uniref:Putative leucine rich repeat protein n=1 Tax=Coleophoma cylindrospora TaxID=1849047 RepID=A0A3D8STK1_9HELO|nr:putative leucine rich repeat protein [Coleophoma cylindrospora]
MAPGEKKGSSARRKSINFLSRAGLVGLTQINTSSNTSTSRAPTPNPQKSRPESPEEAASCEHGEKQQVVSEWEKEKKKKLAKRASMFGLGPPPTFDSSQDGKLSPIERASSPKPRPRTLQKSRPSSIFGSLGKRSGTYNDEETDNLATTPESPLDEGSTPPLEQGRSLGRTVLHHGEVQTSTGMFKKKKEYLVLTDTNLIRFKTQARAHDVFPTIPPAYGRSASTRHPSTTSIGSLQEVQSNNSRDSGSTRENRIPLNQIVTAYKLEDGRPFFTTEVVYLDEEYHGVGAVQLMLHDPKDADLWHTSIRAAAQKAKLIMLLPYPQRVIDYVIGILEHLTDYDPYNFKVFRVVKRFAAPRGGKNSSDDLTKLGSSVYYMAIGINKVHLIPVPDFSAPSRLVSPKTKRESYGIVELVAMNVQYTDDRFDLSFRAPMHPVKVLELAAAANPEIAAFIFKASYYVKPQWIDTTFMFGGPENILDSIEHFDMEEPDPIGHFERTLVAFCLAYNVNPVNVVYSIDSQLEEGPEWKLHPPANTATYSTLELLAIMRALRYNEHFHSISFKDVNLHALHRVTDKHELGTMAWTSRSGIPIEKYYHITHPARQSLLYQEVQALGLKSRRLKKMDFTNTLPRRRPRDNFDVEPETEGQAQKDPGCEIVAALLPICRAELTNVDWIVLSGIELGETDFEFIVPCLGAPRSQIRGIECSRCGLNDRLLQTLVNTVARQCATLQYLDLSDNPGRINVVEFADTIKRFSRIRKLDLSRTPRSMLSQQPLLAPEILREWRLKELLLNGIPTNKNTLNGIRAYLASEASDELETLQLEQCSLSGADVASLMVASSRKVGIGRPMQLKVSTNRIEKDIAEVVQAIEDNRTPTHLVMRMIEFSKEDHFRQLVEALRTNTTIQALDVSKASLPLDAGPETCGALKQLFAENNTLEDLDISGEQSHLEVTRFGIGLNDALTGLKKNKTLRILRIEHQNLGLAGANTLASVLEENQGLTHIYCEHNEISLQGFTTLVNALASNHTVQELPSMESDRQLAIKRMSITARDARSSTANGSRGGHGLQTSVRRTLNNFRVAKTSKPDVTSQDVDEAVRVMEERWEMQVRRLQAFLRRNRRLARGVSEDGDSDEEEHLYEEYLRPTTAMSDRGILEHVLSNTTPKVELGDPVEEHTSKKIPTVSLSHVDAVGGEEKENIISDDSPTYLKQTMPSMKKSPSTDTFNLLPDLQLNSSKSGSLELDDAGSGVFSMDSS